MHFSTTDLHIFLFFTATTNIQQDICVTNSNERINTNKLSNDTDFGNATFSLESDFGYDTINDENNISNCTSRANCNKCNNNITISSNDYDNEDNRARTVDLNVTFSCDVGKSYETIDDSNNSSNNNNSDNMALSCDNGKNYTIVNSTINADNSMNIDDFDNVISSCDIYNEHDYTIINNESNLSNNTRHADIDNVMTISNNCNKYDNVKTGDLNVTFSCDNASANNSVTGVVLNDVMIFPFDEINNFTNISSILDEVVNAETSDCNDNNITFSYNDDDNIISNISSVNTTNVSEYLPSTSEITAELEI